MIANRAKRYAVKAKIHRNHQMMSQKLSQNDTSDPFRR